MKKFFILVAMLFAAVSSAKTAEELLKASDRARGSVERGLTWDSEVLTTEEGRETKKKFKIRAQYVNAYVEALEPARNKGEIYLFRDRTMWFFKPSLRKPVTISPRQKLSGQAANGDIASTNYSRDYTPTIERSEVLDGEKTYVLMLKAKASNLTYDQIRYWVREKDQLAMKAEFLTLQGKVFKRATMKYENKIKGYDGTEYPFISEFTISDAKVEKNRSILKYSNPRLEEHKESLFNINTLKR